MSIVIITAPEFGKAEAVFTAASGFCCIPAPPEEAALASAIREKRASHAIVGTLPYLRDLYAALPRGGVLARFGAGYDGIDLAKATEAGLLCTNTPGVLVRSVAEHAVTLILAAARHVVTLDRRMRESRWAPQAGSEIAGKTLAIIGCGPIGRTVARIASFGLGMRVIGCDCAPPPSQAASECGFEAVSGDFAAAVREADYVSLHIPSIPTNAHYINGELLARLAPRVWLINTARGTLVDEAALYDALRDRRIGGAALDVFEREPYEPVDSARDLRTLDNVILTPHVASNTAEANRRMAERALLNIRLAETGDRAHMDLLNPEVLSR